MPPAAAAPPSSGLAWTAPEGWKKEGPRPMREVSFRTGPGDAVECYVTVLAGAGGGAAANINRWRAQMGHPALSEQEIASLPRVEILGRPSPVVEIAGDYSGMGSSTQASALLYGAICELGTRTVFVKMIGPEGATRPEKDRFLAFCKSLH